MTLALTQQIKPIFPATTDIKMERDHTLKGETVFIKITLKESGSIPHQQVRGWFQELRELTRDYRGRNTTFNFTIEVES